MTQFQQWLVRQRIFCDRCKSLTNATTVRKLNGKDLTLCQEHANRLDAARKSYKKQEITT
jgi:hypothetical protein